MVSLFGIWKLDIKSIIQLHQQGQLLKTKKALFIRCNFSLGIVHTFCICIMVSYELLTALISKTKRSKGIITNYFHLENNFQFVCWSKWSNELIYINWKNNSLYHVTMISCFVSQIFKVIFKNLSFVVFSKLTFTKTTALSRWSTFSEGPTTLLEARLFFNMLHLWWKQAPIAYSIQR